MLGTRISASRLYVLIYRCFSNSKGQITGSGHKMRRHHVIEVYWLNHVVIHLLEVRLGKSLNNVAVLVYLH